MKTGSSFKYIAVPFLLSGLLFAGGCFYSGDSARVVINLGLHNNQAGYQPGIVERLLALVTFSTSLTADPPPYPDVITDLRITAEGPGMSAVVRELTAVEIERGRVEMRVAAGKGRIFTVVARVSWEGEAPHRYYGGIRTADLSPGSSVSISITLGYLPDPPYTLSIIRAENQFAEAFNYVSWDGEDPASVTGYHLYRADSETGNFVKIATAGNPSLDFQGAPLTASFEDYDIDLRQVYWYRVGAYNGFGEGELSSAVPDNG